MLSLSISTSNDIIVTNTLLVEVYTGGDVLDGVSFLINDVEVVAPTLISEDEVSGVHKNYSLDLVDAAFGQTYIVKVQATTDAGSELAQSYITLDVGAWFSAPIQRYSFRTQEIANGYPPYSKARNERGSVFQQLMNPIGLEVEEMMLGLNNLGENLFLQSADKHQLDLMSLYRLKDGEDFQKRPLQNGDYGYLVPTVKGVENFNVFETLVGEENNIPVSARKDLPDRYTSSEVTNLFYNTLLTPQYAIDGPFEDFPPICIPGKVVLAFTNGTTYFLKERRNFSTLAILTGVTTKGTIESETLAALRDGFVTTRKSWNRIDKLEVYASHNIGVKVAIYNLKTINAETLDIKYHYADPNGTMPMYWQLEVGVDSTYIQQRTVISRNFSDVARDNLQLDLVRYVRLLGIDSSDVVLADYALDPFKSLIYGTDGYSLFVYSKQEPWLNNPSELTGTTRDANFEIDITKPAVAVRVGDSIGLSPRHARPRARVTNFRWTVVEPDGTKSYLDQYGGAIASTAWVRYDNQARYGLNIPDLIYMPANSGTYIFGLEVQLTDKTTEVTKQTLQLSANVPLAKYDLKKIHKDLPFTTVRLFIDTEQDLAIQYDTQISKLTFHYDRMFVDFEAKEVYCKELYDSVRIVF